MRLIFTLFLITLFDGLNAQVNLSGTINNLSNAPVSFAAVTLKGVDENRKVVQTDSGGHFSSTI